MLLVIPGLGVSQEPGTLGQTLRGPPLGSGSRFAIPE